MSRILGGKDINPRLSENNEKWKKRKWFDTNIVFKSVKRKYDEDFITSYPEINETPVYVDEDKYNVSWYDTSITASF